jgi:hypothetical protein
MRSADRRSRRFGPRITPDVALPESRWNGTLRPDLRPDRKFFLKCCFESTAVSSGPAMLPRPLLHAGTVRVVAKLRVREKPYFIGVFARSEIRARKFHGRAARSVRFCATAHHGMRRRNRGPDSPTPILKWSRCFFRCAVVIGVAVPSIRDCTVRYRHSLNARRAAWRRKLRLRPSQRQRRRCARPQSARRRSNRWLGAFQLRRMSTTFD